MNASVTVLPSGQKPVDLHALAVARFERSIEVPETFFAEEADNIAQACWTMAKRFHQGGRLIAFGNGAWASDAQHVSVEFVHPVIVGKRALPALSLTNESALFNGQSFAPQLSMLARPEDIAMGFSGAESAERGPLRDILSVIAHFGFGASTGLLYVPFARLSPLPSIITGLIYGFMVWFVSYQGWIPRARILPPATQEPARRNFLMILAHFVWGSVLALLLRRWSQENE